MTRNRDLNRLGWEVILTGSTLVIPLIGPRDDPDLISERALPVARALVREMADPIVFVSVVERPFSVEALEAALNDAPGVQNVWLEELRDYLERIAATFRDSSTQVVIRSGVPVDEIEQELDNVERPVLVMASHGRVGMERMLLGSVAFRVIHDVDCPVILVRDALPADFQIRTVLVPLDGSTAAESALDHALEVLHGLRPRLHLLHVVEPLFSHYGFIDPSYAEMANQWAIDYLSRVSERLQQRGYHVTWTVRRGFVADQIVEVANDVQIDLMVMSTEGHHAVRHAIFGSVTERALHQCGRPLLVVRPVTETTQAHGRFES